jgi:hypothetical protein
VHINHLITILIFQEMVSSFEAFRESLFAVFYIMTEQNNQQSKRVTFGVFRRCILYLIDAGQVIRAVILLEFGWDPAITNLVGKFDFLNLIFDVVGFTMTDDIRFQ